MSRFRNGKTHVRLSARQPHFNKHVLQRYGLANRRDRQIPRLTACLHGIKSQQPLAVPVSRRRFLLVCEPERHLRTRFRLAPNRDGHLALQHAVVGEEFCKSRFVGTQGSERCEQQGGKECAGGFHGVISGSNAIRKPMEMFLWKGGAPARLELVACSSLVRQPPPRTTLKNEPSANGSSHSSWTLPARP